MSKPLLTFGDVIQWVGATDGAAKQWQLYEIVHNAECPEAQVELDNGFRFRPLAGDARWHLIYRGDVAELPLYAQIAKRILDKALRRIQA